MLGRPLAIDVLTVLEEAEQEVRRGWPLHSATAALRCLCDEESLRQETATAILAGAGWPYAMVPGDPRGRWSQNQMHVLTRWEAWPTRQVSSVLRALARAQA